MWTKYYLYNLFEELSYYYLNSKKSKYLLYCKSFVARPRVLHEEQIFAPSEWHFPVQVRPLVMQSKNDWVITVYAEFQYI